MPRKATEFGLGFAGIIVTLVFLTVATQALFPKLGALEGWLFPVNEVTYFEVVEVVYGDAIVQGRFNKNRDCQFVKAQWYKDGGIEIGFERVDEVQALPLGEGHPWGRLRLNVSRETAENDIYAVVIHKCHWLWNTRTVTYRSGE